jgi:hypothetical protein
MVHGCLNSCWSKTLWVSIFAVRLLRAAWIPTYWNLLSSIGTIETKEGNVAIIDAIYGMYHLLHVYVPFDSAYPVYNLSVWSAELAFLCDRNNCELLRIKAFSRLPIGAAGLLLYAVHSET